MSSDPKDTKSAPTLAVVLPLTVTISAVAALLIAVPSSAAPQSKPQQACVNGVNKAGQKVLRAQGKETSACVKLISRRQLGDTFTQCLSSDPKDKVARARTKTLAVEAANCSENPTFAYTGAAAVNDAAVNEEQALANDVLNTIIDAVDDKVGAKCQASGVKAYEKLSAGFVKEFNACKKATLAGDTADAEAVAACVAADPKGNILRAESKLLNALTKKCSGVELGATVGGAFGLACSSGDTISDCTAKIIARVRCRSCRAVAVMDALSTADCDAIDNGIADGSCTRCGDGIVEPAVGEVCDDGNNADGDCCDSACMPEAGSTEGPQGDPTCSDTLDNDCNGLADALDPSCTDPSCPVAIELLGLGETSRRTCATNTDCAGHSGLCDLGLGRCVSASHLDLGYTGLAHSSETLDLVPMRLALACAGPGPTCGECLVAGVDPANGSCRCANDNHTICDEPFSNDADDCGGSACTCYVAPPTPYSSGNTPTCWWGALAGEITGTVNVDTGAMEIQMDQRVRLHLGHTVVTPCPYCSGDTTANDGVKSGTCVLGDNAGESCDVNAWSPSFPNSASGPLDGGASYDCAPAPGKNITGAGTKSTIRFSTAPAQSLPAAIPCGFQGIAEHICPCSVCDNDFAQACSSNADCSAGGVCEEFLSGGQPLPNQCTSFDCTDMGGGVGECTIGPDDSFCDGILRVDGSPLFSCLSNVDCEPGSVGIDAGACTITKRRSCFLDPIVSGGSAHTTQPTSAALFCDAHDAGGGGVQTTLGMPGPTRLLRQHRVTVICPDLATSYTPGVGNCP